MRHNYFVPDLFFSDLETVEKTVESTVEKKRSVLDPKKISPLRGKNNPKSMVLYCFMAPLGAPENFASFCYPLASFSFSLRAIWTSKMIHFPSKRGIYPRIFPPEKPSEKFDGKTVEFFCFGKTVEKNR